MKILSFFIIIAFTKMAQADMSIKSGHDSKLGSVTDIYLGDLCETKESDSEGSVISEEIISDQNGVEKEVNSIHFLLSNKKFATFINPLFCDQLDNLIQENIPPRLISLPRKTGSPWIIRFHFGFSRTTYFPTDMKLESSRINVVIKDFEFKERTSAEFYNPKNWSSIGDAFRWIDEPTNTFTLSLEKNKNIFYLTAFHPKFLKKDIQTKYVKGTIDSIPVDGEIDINESFDGYNNQLGEMYLVRFQNTHKQMDWQIGYGRVVKLFDSKKWGSVSYIPRVDLGITSGEHLTVYTKQGAYWDYDDFKDSNKIQGCNFSVGHRLEYQKAWASVFVEQKFTYAHLKHRFMDGSAEYNMMYMPISFGVGFKLFKTKKKQ